MDLKRGLASLPAPKNDYEIVLPEQDPAAESHSESNGFIEDQADVDARKEAEIAAQRKCKEQKACFETLLIHLAPQLLPVFNAEEQTYFE